MTAARTRPLLRELRLQGVQFLLDDQEVSIDAPAGVVTPTVRRELASSRAEIAQLLGEELKLQELSLSEFEEQDRSVEVRVPWLDQTLWFVPRPEFVARLVGRGVHRGWIWTASELRDLAAFCDGSDIDPRAVGMLKAAFALEILTICPNEGVERD